MQGAPRKAALQRRIDLRQAKREQTSLLLEGSRTAGIKLCDRLPKLAKRVVRSGGSHSTPIECSLFVLLIPRPHTGVKEGSEDRRCFSMRGHGGPSKCFTAAQYMKGPGPHSSRPTDRKK